MTVTVGRDQELCRQAHRADLRRPCRAWPARVDSAARADEARDNRCGRPPRRPAQPVWQSSGGSAWPPAGATRHSHQRPMARCTETCDPARLGHESRHSLPSIEALQPPKSHPNTRSHVEQTHKVTRITALPIRQRRGTALRSAAEHGPSARRNSTATSPEGDTPSLGRRLPITKCHET